MERGCFPLWLSGFGKKKAFRCRGLGVDWTVGENNLKVGEEEKKPPPKNTHTRATRTNYAYGAATNVHTQYTIIMAGHGRQCARTVFRLCSRTMMNNAPVALCPLFERFSSNADGRKRSPFNSTKPARPRHRCCRGVAARNEKNTSTHRSVRRPARRNSNNEL